MGAGWDGAEFSGSWRWKVVSAPGNYTAQGPRKKVRAGEGAGRGGFVGAEGQQILLDKPPRLVINSI